MSEPVFEDIKENVNNLEKTLIGTKTFGHS